LAVLRGFPEIGKHSPCLIGLAKNHTRPTLIISRIIQDLTVNPKNMIPVG